MTKQFIRYIFAVVIGVIAAEALGLSLDLTSGVIFGRDIIFNGEVGGKRWELNITYVVITIIMGCVAGYIAGLIGGRRGIILGAISGYLLIHIQTVYIAILPAMIFGHIAVKRVRRDQVCIDMAVNMIGLLFLYTASAGFIIFHIFTITVAYRVSGFLPAVATIVSPPLSDLYWFFRAWHENGDITNQYDFTFLMLVFVGAFGAAMMRLSAWLEKRKNAAASEG